jgi:uncharacterized protein YodC (DUF2158 family)
MDTLDKFIGDNMQVGTIVRYRNDGDLGIVKDIDATGMYYVKWSDGKEDWHLRSEMEIVCK